MNPISREDFKKAYKMEKDIRISRRMLAVYDVRVLGMSAEDVAEQLMQCPNWIHKWVGRFDADGLDGLRDLPRSGRPPLIPRRRMDRLMYDMSHINGVTPAKVRQHLHEKTGIILDITNVRKIMHRYNMTPKRHTIIHVNRASRGAVRSWQYRLERRISRLKRRGYTVVVQDESIFVHGVMQGRAKWSLRGSPILMPYTGSHKRLVMYGAVSEKGEQFVRTYPKFDSNSFVNFVMEMHRHFGKVAVIADRAPQHRSVAVREMLASNRHIKMIYLPTGSPQLNAIEELWHRAKRDLMVSQYYPTFDDLRHAVSEYFRTARHHLDIQKYLYRKAEESLTNF